MSRRARGLARHRRTLQRLAVAGVLAAAGSAAVALDATAQAPDPAVEQAKVRTVTVTPTDQVDLHGTVDEGLLEAYDQAFAARLSLTASQPPPPPAAPASTSVSLSVWDRLAQCESGGNWSINTGNGFYGGLQFTLDSWRWVGGSGYPHHASKAEQIKRAEILLSRQGWQAWPSCSRQLGLR